MRAFVGLGANLGNPVMQVRAGIAAIAVLPRTRLVARSSLYRTAPIGYLHQPDFVNAVIAVDTGLDAVTLLAALRDTEARHGRARPFPNAPRTLDLDLLLYGEETIATPALVVPHPRMHERAFVLRPLLDLDPQLRVPGLGSGADLLARITDQRIEPVELPSVKPQ
jgi:2-amino-4-hydroxy-6-hydroxymethyldihydropteridine diphosphokinase